MRLKTALRNLRSLNELIGPANWFDGPEPGAVQCSHTENTYVTDRRTGQFKRNKRGDMVVRTIVCRNDAEPDYAVCCGHGAPRRKKLTAIKGTRIPDPMRLVRMRADINTTIARRPPRRRAMINLLYVQPLPLAFDEVPGEWTDEREAVRVAQIMHQLGYNESGVFWADHNETVADMERELLNYFPEARNAA